MNEQGEMRTICCGWLKDDYEPNNKMELKPSEDVYSYFMFIAPTEKKKEKSAATFDTLMAFLLVFLNIFFQGILLYAVFWRVVVKTNEWRSEITQFGPVGQTSLMAGPAAECNDGSSLCRIEGGNFTCAPPSVQLTSRWEELDVNGDGYWTREEVLANRDALKCKYVVDPLEVFDVFVKTVLNREGIIWIHPDLRAGKAIHKAYFTYASGDVIMCGYRNNDMCGNLFQSGFFDAALEFNTVPRVGNTIDAARKYCHELLKPGGFCDLTLPSTYAVWKIESAQECKKAKYGKFVYKHPQNHVQKALLAVDYSARQDIQTTKTPLFRVFLFIILSIWMLAMIDQLKQIVIIFTWVAKFKSDKDFKNDDEVLEQGEGSEKTYIIQGISAEHRVMVALITCIRTVMLAVLTVVGVMMLLKSTGYTDLVMDAVSLVFILEIGTILYVQVLRPQIREQVENLIPMEISPEGLEWLNSRPALVDLLYLVLVFVSVVLMMASHYTVIVDPLFQALECTCVNQGATCREANKFNYGFWHHYWKEQTPNVFKEINQLKSQLSLTQAKMTNNQNRSMMHQFIQQVVTPTRRSPKQIQIRVN